MFSLSPFRRRNLPDCQAVADKNSITWSGIRQEAQRNFFRRSPDPDPAHQDAFLGQDLDHFSENEIHVTAPIGLIAA
jgi:hypothetical protein